MARSFATIAENHAKEAAANVRAVEEGIKIQRERFELEKVRQGDLAKLSSAMQQHNDHTKEFVNLQAKAVSDNERLVDEVTKKESWQGGDEEPEA